MQLVRRMNSGHAIDNLEQICYNWIFALIDLYLSYNNLDPRISETMG